MNNNDKAKRSPKEFINRIVKSNKFIFVISLIAAIALWITVAPNRQVSIPVTLNIDTSGSSADSLGLEVVGGQGQAIDVTVAGKWYVISELGEKDIKINYSLADVTKAGDYELSLSATKVGASSDYEIVKVVPDKINVSFDYIFTRSFTIEAKAANVKAESELILGTPVISTDSSIIDITGPKSIVDKISKVTAEVDNAETLKDTKTYNNVPLKLLDKKGREISPDSLKMPYADVDVTVPINIAKTLPVKVGFANAPEYYQKNPLGYTLYYSVADKSGKTSLKVLSKLDVIGTREALDTVEDIELGVIDFGSITPKSRNIKFEVKLPSGVSSVDDISTVICRLDVSNLASTNIEVTKFVATNGSPDMNINVITSNKQATIVAPKSVISALSASDIYFECDMTDFADKTGDVLVPARIRSQKYNNLWVTGEYTVQVRITK